MTKKLTKQKLISLFIFSIVALAFAIGRLRWMDVENSNRDIYNWIFSFESNYFTPILKVEIGYAFNPFYFYNQDANTQPISNN